MPNFRCNIKPNSFCAEDSNCTSNKQSVSIDTKNCVKKFQQYLQIFLFFVYLLDLNSFIFSLHIYLISHCYDSLGLLFLDDTNRNIICPNISVIPFVSHICRQISVATAITSSTQNKLNPLVLSQQIFIFVSYNC